MRPFYGWGFNCFEAEEPLEGEGILFTTKSPWGSRNSFD